MQSLKSDVVTRQVQSVGLAVSASPPGSRGWSSGICSCFSDCRSCKLLLRCTFSDLIAWAAVMAEQR